VDSDGIQSNADSGLPSISADGRFIAFESAASNLVPGDTNNFSDVFVYDRQTAKTELVSVSSNGTQANSYCDYPCISPDGRYVAFYSPASTLVPGDTNGVSDVFLRDRLLGTTERISVGSTGIQGDADSTSTSNSLSADIRFVVFASVADNLVAGDTNVNSDAFLHDRSASGFASICSPGVDNLIACPCSNAPSGPGRGCDNSSATGGAILQASGVAYVSMDSVVFTTSSEKPTATSIVMQGTAHVANGLVFGQGVRCVGGTLKRLYTKSAVLGGITAPDFAAGDLAVSARSAALGDFIQAGESRWYLVYYRDPIVLYGCPASSTFNATQTGRVSWSL
jgi:Tol biopolymer transport system component